jgi:hypothetical protein
MLCGSSLYVGSCNLINFHILWVFQLNTKSSAKLVEKRLRRLVAELAAAAVTASMKRTQSYTAL